MEVSCQLHALAALPRGNSPWYKLDMRLGGPQSRYGQCGKVKNLLLLPEIELGFLGRPASKRSLCRLSSNRSYQSTWWQQSGDGELSLYGHELILGRGKKTFLFFTASSPALRSTQSTDHQVPGFRFQGLKRPRHEAKHLSQSSAGIKKAQLYLHSPYVFMAPCLIRHKDNCIFIFLNVTHCSDFTKLNPWNKM
jgi:hypothetical protein